MKKIKISLSFFLLVIICFLLNNFILLVNYLLALILHELAHLFVATKCGYSLKQFKVDIFGVSVELDEKIDDKDNFAINIAGPMFNLFLCLICLALYSIIPSSYKVLNVFCVSNLILAVFNLLPVYPLDGGKIFKALIKDNKKYKILDTIIRFTLGIICIVLFILSIFKKTNFFFLIFAIFFLLSKAERQPSLSLFKYSKHKRIEKVVLLKTDGEDNLFTLLKKIKTNHYTIFYYNQKIPTYLDEDKIIELSTKHPLLTKLKEIINK